MSSSIRVILLDIEGTTTHLDFVFKELFPFARAHLREFLSQHWNSEDVRQALTLLRRRHEADEAEGINPPKVSWNRPQVEPVLKYLNWLMERDSKDTGLKLLQGRIWEEGYGSGELKSHIFPDVPLALRRWRAQEKEISIFSSGSVLAQKLLFAHTVAGDLTPYISQYFDTNIGGKRERSSYESIAEKVARSPAEVMFVSDVGEELDAAQQAGMQTVLCVRPGNHPLGNPVRQRICHSFDEISSEP